MYLVWVVRAEVPMPEWIWFAICVYLAKHKYAKEINVIQSQKVLKESQNDLGQANHIYKKTSNAEMGIMNHLWYMRGWNTKIK